jgi:hypothetical protein
MNGSFKEHLARSRRLAMLRLMRDGGGSANESVLHTAVLSLGFPTTTREEIRADLEWLQQRRLVKLDQFAKPNGGIIMIGNVTEAGIDASRGRGEPIEGLARSDYPE